MRQTRSEFAANAGADDQARHTQSPHAIRAAQSDLRWRAIARAQDTARRRAIAHRSIRRRHARQDAPAARATPQPSSARPSAVGERSASVSPSGRSPRTRRTSAIDAKASLTSGVHPPRDRRARHIGLRRAARKSGIGEFAISEALGVARPERRDTSGANRRKVRRRRSDVDEQRLGAMARGEFGRGAPIRRSDGVDIRADLVARKETTFAGVKKNVRNADLARGDGGDRHDATRPAFEGVGELRRHCDAMTLGLAERRTRRRVAPVPGWRRFHGGRRRSERPLSGGRRPRAPP